MGQHNFPVRNFWVTLVKLLNENLLRYVLLITFERWPLVSSSSSSPSSILSCCMYIYIYICVCVCDISIYIYLYIYYIYIYNYNYIYIYLWTTLWSLVIEHGNEQFAMYRWFNCKDCPVRFPKDIHIHPMVGLPALPHMESTNIAEILCCTTSNIQTTHLRAQLVPSLLKSMQHSSWVMGHGSWLVIICHHPGMEEHCQDLRSP